MVILILVVPFKSTYLISPYIPTMRKTEVRFGLLVYWGLTPQQQPGSYQGGEMMMKSVFWWRKPEYPEESTDLLPYINLLICVKS